jgi:hypothetical protein
MLAAKAKRAYKLARQTDIWVHNPVMLYNKHYSQFISKTYETKKKGMICFVRFRSRLGKISQRRKFRLDLER